jgi:outer membrane protein
MMRTATFLLLLASVLASLATAQSAAQPPEPSASTGRLAADSVPDRFDLDAVLQEPGVPWSIAKIARRSAQSVHLVDAADRRIDQAVATTQEVRAAAIPQFDLRARYTRLSPIDNAPLAPIPIDFDQARATAGLVTDPNAQALWQQQIDVLEGISQGTIGIPQNQYNFRASVRYPLLALFVEILPGIRTAQNAETASRFESNVARNDTALELIEIYMDHARARGSLAVAELALQQAEANRAQSEARLRGGVGNRPDVARFEARVALSQRGVAEARADVEATANALRALLDLEGTGPLAFEERLTEVPEPAFRESTQDLVEAAWKLRDEMQAANALVRARGHAARSARGAMAPGVGVEAAVDYGRPNVLFTPPVDEFRTSWNVSAVVSWSPDGTWSASRAKERALAQEAEAKAQREQLKDFIRIEVVRAEATYRASLESVRAAKRQVDAAEEAYAAKRRGFEVGVSNVVEVIDSEIDVNRARLALIDAAARLRVRESALRTAIGEHLWE